ncbi:MAG TPA: HD domain-containing protein [Chthoniobacterales bacterium]|nr:HD domain-containing protein [Chthoniobacterales bacterium]
MQLLTLKEIRQAVPQGALEARVHVQLETVAAKFTREQKPYCELTLADAADRMTLRVWSDSPNFKACDAMQSGDFVEITGEFYQHQQYGLDARQWKSRPLTAEERAHLLQGPAELRAKQAADWEFIVATTAAIRDPRLYSLCAEFIAQYGARFRNTAGARTYHHARRGGLVEHTAQMMRVATEIAPQYPGLNLDLLVAGILFHDAGKLWENYLPETGFSMPFDELGEMVGHIGIGLEVVNSLWQKIKADGRAAEWQKLSPPTEDCRLHLLHLIASHHGEPQFGSPVYPKTPEALALNYIDNLDARLEMIFAGYAVAKPLAGRIFERVRPLPGNLITPLAKFSG